MSLVTRIRLFAALSLSLLMSFSATARSQEVLVSSSIDETISWLKSENFWGEEARGEQLKVPHALITGINPNWRVAAQKLTVPEKKEIFYRLMLPLILHANDMVLDRRAGLVRVKTSLAAGQPISDEDLLSLRKAAVLLRITDEETAATLNGTGDTLAAVIDEALYKLDVIPAGLVLGQAAYESGYGTSRFAAEGNALFGQWTYGGKGLVPEQQRKNLGDHRIAAFDWPFDSVRGYFINLMSHPAYEEFRRLRAQKRTDGQPLRSLELADGLINYSERGQEYVDTLKSMIRVNNLSIADDASFRDEPIRFLIGAPNAIEAAALKSRIEEMRKTGELEQTIVRMRLE
ncbi:MAG: glucosaminidase domain-containing protein [Gammaproteobacteria bacterium]|nr:glucosaminidase domain-containing protein [Gammaproteobacteria bacterium]